MQISGVDVSGAQVIANFLAHYQIGMKRNRRSGNEGCDPGDQIVRTIHSILIVTDRRGRARRTGTPDAGITGLHCGRIPDAHDIGLRQHVAQAPVPSRHRDQIPAGMPPASRTSGASRNRNVMMKSIYAPSPRRTRMKPALERCAISSTAVSAGAAADSDM